jgi:methionine-rich copper-binding protein CopC
MALVALFAITAGVSGHAEYDHSIPDAGEVIFTAPTQVEIFFDNDLLASGPGEIHVFNPYSVEIDNNDETLDPGDHSHLTVTLNGNTPFGFYTVQWVSVAEDGDEEEGEFQFRYRTVSLGGVAESLAEGGGPGGIWTIWLLAGISAATAAAMLGGRVVFARRQD